MNYHFDADRDTLWHVAGKYAVQGGYTDTYRAWKAILNANPSIQDPHNVPDGTVIVIPLAS